MDKTFNDLMDIVNRTKKIDGKDSRPAPRPKAPVVEESYDDEYTPREFDLNLPKKRKTKSEPLADEDSAIGKLLNKSTKKAPAKKKTTTKSSTAKKKTTTKSSSKTTPKKKVEEKAETVAKKPATKPAKTPPPTISASTTPDPKNAQLYEALQNSLFSGGTDISEYMNEDTSLDEAQSSLKEIRAKREAQKINAEISKEQQEYEQLFTGSFLTPQPEETPADEEPDEQKEINVAEKNAELNNELNKIKATLESKKNNPSVARTEKTAQDSTFELETGNKDLDKKIAEYYRRKQEKINKYNAEEEIYDTPSPKQEDEAVDYASIFGGEMTTRAELMGEPVEESQDTTNTNPDVAEETNVVQDEQPTTEEQENIVPETPEQEPQETEEVQEENNEVAEKENTQPTENQEEISSNETTEKTNSKEENIKNILSDLLFNKKAHEAEENKSDTNAEESQEDSSEQNTEEQPMSREDYAKVWGGTLEEESQEEVNEEENNTNSTEESTQEESATEEKQEVVGDNFVMTDAEEEKKEVVEYIDRTPAEIPSDTEENQEIEEQETTSDMQTESTQEESNEDDSTEQDNISEESVAEENTSEETEEEKVEEQPVNYSIIDEDEDGDFIIRFNNNSEESSTEDTEENTTETVASEEQATEETNEETSSEEPTEQTAESSDIIEDTTSEQENTEIESTEEETLTNNTEVSQEETNNSSDTAPHYTITDDDDEDTVAEYQPQEEINEETSAFNETVEYAEETNTPSEEENTTEEIAPEEVTTEENTTPVYNIIDDEPEDESQEINNTETSEQKENIYDLSDENSDVSDYILSSNIPEESTSQNTEETITNETSESVEDSQEEPQEEQQETIEEQSNTTEENTSDNDYDSHFESVVNNERIYENTIRPMQKGDVFNDEEDSIFVMNTTPEKKWDLFGNEIKDEDEEKEEKEEIVEKVEEKDDTISKEEFYNEMARLQENLINELKGNNIKTESKDFFAEKEPTPEVDEEKAESVAEEMIAHLTQEIAEDEEESLKEAEETQQPQVEETISAIEEGEVGSKAEPVDPEKFDEFNLLGKDIALNESDLEYQEKSEEEPEPAKDVYFYGSTEDNEKKSAIADEYMTIYNEPSNVKEVGDINFFKNIGNAVPSSSILDKEEEPKEVAEEEIEAIYTLMGIQKKPAQKQEPDIKVLYVASECQPFIASGGLGDVAGSLPKAIAQEGSVDIRVILPLYGNIKNEYRDKFEYLGNFTVHLSWRQEYCGLFRYFKDGVTYYFVDNERYFKRDKLYGYYDDGERFAYFSKAVVEALPHLNFFPDVVHCNDWQSSLVSAYIKTCNWSDFRYYKIKNVYTIHNVEYQGVFGMENLKDLFGIDNRFRNEMEYNKDINLTKSAIQYCDRLTTVSRSYCDNLKQPYCSRGLHHIIIRNEYKLSGIINGIDYDFYNPATDTCLFKNYDLGCIEEKVLNKKLWQDEMGLPVDGDTPMIAIVSRLVSHKGLDLVSKIIEQVLQEDVQLVVVGTGDQRYIDYYKYLENKYPTKVRAFVDKYSIELARKAYGASDIFLMPSKIEPCGISQMIASRYGSVPIVREVGGLKDTIKDFGCEGGGNGYTFTNYNPNDLLYQINRAIRDYGNKSEWKEKMKICMTTDFTWNNPAKDYINLYKSLK